MNLNISAHRKLINSILSQQPFGTGASLRVAPGFISKAVIARGGLVLAQCLLIFFTSTSLAKESAKSNNKKETKAKIEQKSTNSPIEQEARKLLNQFSNLQKSFLKKHGRYASEMFELIPPIKKKGKPPEVHQNSHFIVSFSPACVLASAAAKKATRLLLYYPEFPDDKKAVVQLNPQFAKQFEFLLKRKVKDLPKGKCPANNKGYELYAVGFPEGSKNPIVWSIDQDGSFKKSR